MKNDIIDPNITIPEPKFKGQPTVERHLKQLKSREGSRGDN